MRMTRGEEQVEEFLHLMGRKVRALAHPSVRESKLWGELCLLDRELMLSQAEARDRRPDTRTLTFYFDPSATRVRARTHRLRGRETIECILVKLPLPSADATAKDIGNLLLSSLLILPVDPSLGNWSTEHIRRAMEWSEKFRAADRSAALYAIDGSLLMEGYKMRDPPEQHFRVGPDGEMWLSRTLLQIIHDSA